ncbi:MAG: T9SS type A sorting domain-containing protein [Saprospiraceae bacterium]
MIHLAILLTIAIPLWLHRIIICTTTTEIEGKTVFNALNTEDLSFSPIFEAEYIYNIFQYNEEWYFASQDNDVFQLSKLNGQETNSIYTSDEYMGDFVEFKGDLYFYEDNLMVKYDGTGTEIIYTFESWGIFEMSATEDQIILIAQIDDARYLVTSDGTTGNTSKYFKLNEGSEFNSKILMTPVGHKVFFWFKQNDENYALFVTDGTESGTKKLIELNKITFEKPKLNQSIVAYNNKLYFKGWLPGNTQNNYDMFVSDGTVAGTKLVFDDSVIMNAKSPELFHIYNDDLIFKVRNDWWNPVWYKITKSNSTPIRFLPELSIGSTYMVDYSDNVIFSAFDEDEWKNVEIYKSDGTANNTFALTDISTDDRSYYPFDLTAVGEKIFFIGDDPEFGRELHVYDPLLNSTNDQATKTAFDIYPNPVSQLLSIDNLEEGNKLVKIINNQGQLIYEENHFTKSIQISTSNFNIGMYYIQVFGEHNEYSVKNFIKN